MRIFKTRTFAKWAKKEKITNAAIKAATSEMQSGLFDGNLGSGLYKKRIGRAGKGKRSGHRLLVVFKKGDCAFFVFGFSKNDRDNIDHEELTIYRQLAQQFFSLSDEMTNSMLKEKTLVEVKNE